MARLGGWQPAGEWWKARGLEGPWLRAASCPTPSQHPAPSRSSDEGRGGGEETRRTGPEKAALEEQAPPDKEVRSSPPAREASAAAKGD